MKVLTNKVALIAGGAGTLGEGIVHQLLEAGATVIVPSRSPEKIRKLKEYVPAEQLANLHSYSVDISDVEAAGQFRGRIYEEFGVPDLSVASLGGWWQGSRLIDVPVPTWDRLLGDNLKSHFLFLRTFLPAQIKKNKGLYVLINGFSGVDPYPMAGPISIACAALIMMGRQIAKEHADAQVNIRELVLGPLNTRARQFHNPTWYSARDIGDHIIKVFQEPSAYPEVVTHLFDKQQ